MADDNSNQVTPSGGQKPATGSQRIPFFKDKGRPSILSVSDANRLVGALNKLLNVDVHRIPAEVDGNGNSQNTGKFIYSGENIVLELRDAGAGPQTGSGDDGTANIVTMQITSYTVGDDFCYAVLYDYSTGASGSAVGVALPWDLREAQIPAGDPPITKPYQAGDIILAVESPTGETGVDGCDYEDLNLAGRTRNTLGNSITYAGTYSIYNSYSVGQVVRVMSGTSQGVWICVIANGPTVSGGTSTNQPTWPEPATTGGTNYWENIALGVQALTSCASGGGTIYVNGLPPA